MPKIPRGAGTILLVAVSLVLFFVAGYIYATRTSPGTSTDLDIVAQAWNIILHDYVDKDQLNTDVLRQGAIEGIIKALDDPYTSYLSTENYQLGLTSLEGEFGGIGAQVTIRDKQLKVVAPIPGSPAAEAGLRAGDTILEVDGKPTAEMDLAEAVLNIRGPEGATVTLLVLHEGGSKPEQIDIVRAEIKVHSVLSEMREDIAYLRITHFSERTTEELLPELQSTTQETTAGIILDLRGNPGGLLEVVIDVASYFLHEGVVVNVVDSQGKRTALEVEPQQLSIDLPVVVLTDNHSASGSEVLAGALQDNDRATIAGARTFGKGSVNVLRQLKDGSGLYITTARWLTPKGRLIEGQGLLPDYELDLKGEEAIQWAIGYLKGIK